MTDFFYLGVDPGSVNCGWALRANESSAVAYGVFNPSNSDSIITAADDLLKVIRASRPLDIPIQIACVERYVAYRNTLTKDTEKILLFIGSLLHALQSSGITIMTARAIDWKPAVCKSLYKKREFKNPSEKFDKEYSVAAAECVLGRELKRTNHEADAICLSYYAEIARGSK